MFRQVKSADADYLNKPKRRTQKNKRGTQMKGEECDEALEQADLRGSEIFSLEMDSQNILKQNGHRGIIEPTDIIKTQLEEAVSDLP
ncbi:hypothetical protein DUI87_13257 [Hirundo rustica rustica]|uniref:Uncharacterized protein n=1 Tax=Hirundo rustica rustica TaxID=333673 RepID=A0A3M0KBD7_HIRRU|nr:hypothetical protein DUI87_13257 [Hirundo rustica rustica]